MADGLARVAGIGETVEFGGKQCRIHPRVVGHEARIEAEILRRRSNPLDLVVEAVRQCRTDKDELDIKELDAVAQVVASNFRGWRNTTPLDEYEFEQSSYGEAFIVWLGLGAEESGITVDEVRHVLAEEVYRRDDWAQWKQGLKDAISRASGTDELGNSTGPRPGAQPAA